MPIIAPYRTVKIQSKGIASLSPDLTVLGKSFAFEVDRRRKRLTLDANSTKNRTRLRLWKAGRARSGMISVKGVLGLLNIDPKEVQGKLYDVKVRGKKIVVQF